MAAIVIIVNIFGLARVECWCHGCRDGLRRVALCHVGRRRSRVIRIDVTTEQSLKRGGAPG